MKKIVFELITNNGKSDRILMDISNRKILSYMITHTTVENKVVAQLYINPNYPLKKTSQISK
jgi:hypothetical protein